MRRFQREARAAAQMAHPNVVVVYDADQVGKTYFIAMEHVEGTDLSRLVKQVGPLPVDLACDYIRQAALGLQYIHERGMVHRDIKPSNLLVSQRRRARPRRSAKPSAQGGALRLPRPADPSRRPGPAPDDSGSASGLSSRGVVKVLDMGLVRLVQAGDTGQTSAASLTREGSVVGTPDYIAPEQARNAHRVDIRADLYSLGCTFYYLLTGRTPFPEGGVIEKLLMHQMDEPRPVDQLRPEVPKEVAAVISKLMAKRPEERYQEPDEVAEVLATVQAPTSAPPARPSCRRSPAGRPRGATASRHPRPWCRWGRRPRPRRPRPT